ncbi:MAG: enoyl-CoA hydratase/isomerase family protein [Planctomycetes bacterium]|nr:enoyl-CoA hydratase/isomerase family protein [Planctomycetota bacterium]
MDEQRTLLEIADRIAIVTLNAPERRNAIDRAMVDALHADLTRLESVPELAAVVITGAGDKAFAAGADIAQLKERTSRDAAAAINSTLFARVENFPVPMIAAVRGFCLGGGCELAIACDLRVAGQSAKFGQPEVTLGIIPAAGATYRLPRLIGLGRARDLVYTGRILDAAEAERIGLVNRVVPDAEVLDAALALAREIAHAGPLAVRAAKAAMNALARPNEGMALTLESALQAVLFDSTDKHARMQAFLDKRQKKS